MTGWSYPLNGEVVCAERIGRWRPLLGWVLAIPLFLWLLVLLAGAEVVRILGWFAIVFSGRLPKRFGDYQVAVLRYEWRVSVYLYGLTDIFPGWRVTAGYVDPGDYPAAVYSARPAVRRRATVFFRTVLIIPQLLVLLVVTVAAVAVLIVAWFAVLVAGHWPKRLQTFVIGWLRWTIRVEGYWFLLVDEYPPFGVEYESRPPRTSIESPPSTASEPSEQRPPQPDAAEPDRLPSPVVPGLAPINPAPPAQATVVQHAEPIGQWDARPLFRPKNQGPGQAVETSFAGPAVPSHLEFDPAAATGPPWPRLVAAEARYARPRLLRWPIAVGTVLLALVITGSVLRANNGQPLPTYRPPYVFTANDAHFTATFPSKPDRSEKIAGSTSIVLYHSDLANHSVAVAYHALPAGDTFDLQAAVTGAAEGMHGTLLSHTSLTYHDQPAEDGVISVSHAVARVRAVVFGASVYLFEAAGTSASTFTDDYKTLLDSFTSTSESPPLAAKVVAPPDGFAISQDPQAHTGPITAAEFDKTWGDGTAASSHEVAGYQAYYDSTQDDDGIAVYLYHFASATDAISFKAAVSRADIDAKYRVANYPPIPGAETQDSTVVDSSGTHEHDIIATKGDTAMIVSYIDYRPARPPLLGLLARQQYARL
jgi:Domain of unknown function (DUF4389)